MTVANTLAYYNTATITVIKSFIAYVVSRRHQTFFSSSLKNKLECLSLTNLVGIAYYLRVKLAYKKKHTFQIHHL
jgi:hypothetical protein